MMSIPHCDLFTDRLFQYGPACAIASKTKRFLVYYPLGSGKTLSALHGARVFLDKYPDGKLVVLTTLSNVETTWRQGIKMYRSATDNVHRRAFTEASIHGPDWWYSQNNKKVAHYNKIMRHLERKKYTRQSLQSMSPGELMRACESSKVSKEFRKSVDAIAGENKKLKRLSMLKATIPSGPYCIIIDECQGYINPSAQTALVLELCAAAEVVMLLSATPVHDSYRYVGLKDLLGNPRSMVRSVLWTDFSANVPEKTDPGPEYVVLTTEEWTAHKKASSARNTSGMSQNAYLNKSRQVCNCTKLLESDGLEVLISSKWEAMASKIEEDLISSPDEIIRMVVYSFFRDSGVDGFFTFLRKRWGASVQDKKIKHVIDGTKVRVSTMHDKTLSWFNKDGSEAKILLLTSKDGVGISLKNVGYFHLMEPQWSDAEDEQAIGRARRTKSHTLVSPNVRVYRWVAQSPSFTRGKTADEKVRAQMLDKKRRTDRLLGKIASAGEKYLSELLSKVSIE